MTTGQEIVDATSDWYDSLPRYSGGMPARGSIAAALVVVDRVRSDFDLRLDSHLAAGGAQIKGLNETAVQQILARFGEERQFLKVGGRTNRGGPRAVRELLARLDGAGLADLSPDERESVLDDVLRFLASRVTEYFNRQRLTLAYAPGLTTRGAMESLLESAREAGKEGPVAQYLIGAKLQLRLPNEEVENASSSTPDDQLERPGDFLIQDTVFHVTVHPMQSLYEKCQANLKQGLRPYIIVPGRSLEGTRQNVNLEMLERVEVVAIEAFISQNLEELAGFSAARLLEQLRALLALYNERVDQVESDKSMLIDIPPTIAST